MNESELKLPLHRGPRRSESIAALAQALAKAQGQFAGAKKDAANPYFKSKYADLASVWEAIRDALAENGLAVMQFPRSTESGVEVETMLTHSSGEWISETLALPVAKADAQGIGSAITYARRYGLQSICGVAPEDDDGNAAADSSKILKAKGLKVLTPAAEKGTAALQAAWALLSNEIRAVCKDDLAALKATAAEHDHAPARA